MKKKLETMIFDEPTFYLMRPLGFEPRTCGLRVRCSAVELEALGDTTLAERGVPSAAGGARWVTEGT